MCGGDCALSSSSAKLGASIFGTSVTGQVLLNAREQRALVDIKKP